MEPGDLIIVSFVNSHEVGETFEEWPLHVTVGYWARGEEAPAALAAVLQGELKGFAAFDVTVGPEMHFADGTMLVNEIVQETPLHRLHDVVKSVEIGAGFTCTAIDYPEYQPHVTVQESARLQAGDTFTCKKLSIVQQHGDYKEVVAEVSLGAA